MNRILLHPLEGFKDFSTISFPPDGDHLSVQKWSANYIVQVLLMRGLQQTGIRSFESSGVGTVFSVDGF
ncbi:hypothetical protein Mapa_012259 [Marchantia paleacea]|nr:hypothetical protein Mapa_012259 [Marchantia paleacea]